MGNKERKKCEVETLGFDAAWHWNKNRVNRTGMPPEAALDRPNHVKRCPRPTEAVLDTAKTVTIRVAVSLARCCRSVLPKKDIYYVQNND